MTKTKGFRESISILMLDMIIAYKIKIILNSIAIYANGHYLSRTKAEILSLVVKSCYRVVYSTKYEQPFDYERKQQKPVFSSLDARRTIIVSFCCSLRQPLVAR